MNEAIKWVQANWAEIVAAVGGLVIVARVVVKLTPTPKDDKVFAKVIALLKHIGLYIPVLLACLFLLPSCETVPDWAEGIDGRFYLITDSGAKGGLSFDGASKAVGVWGKLLDEDGNELFGGETFIPIIQDSGK